jgi:hypothetical protein
MKVVTLGLFIFLSISEFKAKQPDYVLMKVDKDELCPPAYCAGLNAGDSGQYFKSCPDNSAFI